MKISQARRAWKQAALRGDMSWLEDCTFISASCFAVPPLKVQTRAWDRIPVPTAVAFGTDRKIYKRVSAKQYPDKQYNEVVAELESQGFGERKRARKDTYARPYPGHVDFEPKDEMINTGTQDLALAREEVSIAYRNIGKDNRNFPALPHKRSTYEPTKVTWIPRKRHNTRWPINPPNKNATMIADLQPLIKFELYNHQIDDPALWNQDQQQTLEPNQEIQEAEQTKKPNNSRRRTLRPSLGTIFEEPTEGPGIHFLTPNAKTGPAYMSPVKRWSAPVDRFKTPTKIAGSPVSKFTLSATPEAGQFEITNERGHFRVPSPTNTETTAGVSDTEFDTRGHQPVPSPTRTESTTRHTTATETTTYETATENTYHTAVPTFDQPIDQAQTEPEHESKRRISLDNARRSDRRSDTKVLKRVKNWIESTQTVNRRHSDVAHILGQPHQGTNRRHTLDVDVGRNPDIFAQKMPETGDGIPQEQSEQVSDQVAEQPAKSVFDIKFEDFKRKMARRKHSPMNGIDVSADIDEEVLKMYLDPESATNLESMEPPRPLEQSSKRYTPGMEIPWDDFKLFAGVKIASTTSNTSEMVLAQDINNTNAIVSESILADAMDMAINSEENTNSTSSEDEEEGGEEDLSEAPDAKMDISVTNNSEDSELVCVDEPTVDVFDGTIGQVEDEDETTEGMATETDEDMVMASEEDKDTADDDSALALLHSFVRRAQHSKEGKQSTTEDSVPILPSTMAKKHYSNSMGAATSDTGSPMARHESQTTTPSPRKPLGIRDANRSPSPKKRKLGETEDAPLVKQSGRLAKPDLEDIEPSQPKKRRKRMESDTDDIFNPEMDVSQVLTQKSRGIARRSSRIATTKSSKADNAHSGFSTIPVRLPGSSGMLQDPDMPAVSTTGITNAVLQRKVEKDLVTETRANTRRNKGGAVPVPVALVFMAQQQQQQQQPTGESPIETSATKARPTGGKTVRWNPTLARVQGEEESSIVGDIVTSPEVQEAPNSGDGKHDEDDENLPSPPRMRHVGLSPNRPANPVTGQPDGQTAAPSTAPAEPQPRAEPEKKQLPRRSTRSTTASRLPRGASPAVTATPKKSSLPAPSRVTKPGRPAPSKGVASSIARRLSTPAPKRRGPRR